MSTTQDLVHVLKAELRAAGVTYADIAAALGMSESSVKRVFAKGDMPLSRIDEMLRVLKMDFAELARKVADAQPLSRQLTIEQEAAVVADRRLLLVLGALAVLLVTATTVLRLGYREPSGRRMTLLDALYFTVETIATVK